MYRPIIFVLIVCVLASVFTAWLNGMLGQASFDDWRDDSEYYNARALSLIHTGSLGEEQALFRRPPGYSFFLAAIYTILGEHIPAVWVVQAVLFCGILMLFWRISMWFLEGLFSVLPSLFLGLYWGFHVYVFQIGSEMFSVFLVMLFIFFLMRYRDIPWMRYLVACGIAGGILALTKPVFLYAVPFFLGWLLYEMRGGYKTWFHAAGAFVIVCAFAGGWALRTYALFGEVETERVGHIIYTRALYGTLSWKEIGLHAASSLTGDYIVDQFSSGYGENPASRRLGKKRLEAFTELRAAGLTPADAEQQLLGAGLSLIKKHPLKFAAGAVPLVFDLNTPENISGFPITPMFVGTREYLQPWQKITIVLAIRAFWFLVLGICIGGAWKLLRGKQRALFIPFLFLILFFNGVHAALIIPPEPRFLVPVLPFYFLCFAAAIQAATTHSWIKTLEKNAWEKSGRAKTSLTGRSEGEPRTFSKRFFRVFSCLEYKEA